MVQNLFNSKDKNNKKITLNDVNKKKKSLKLKSKQHNRKVKIQSGSLQKEDIKQTNITMSSTSGYQPNVSCFCHLCKNDEMIDMVLCNQCLKYVHVEFDGLAKKGRSQKRNLSVLFACNLIK